MESFTISRHELANVLCSLKGDGERRPVDILCRAWQSSRSAKAGRHVSGREPLPPIVDKLMRESSRKGLSLHEIAELGQLAEYASPAATSLQNWVKRDFKDYFQSPQAGKKYSLDQAALLLIIDDLKNNLDFESLRGLLSILYSAEAGKGKSALSDGLVSPLSLYSAYTLIYEDLKSELGPEKRFVRRLEDEIRRRAERAVTLPPDSEAAVREAVNNFLLLAVISVQTAFYQAMARRYCQETLYLGQRRL